MTVFSGAEVQIYRRMVVWKRTQKSTCCLQLARFLFVKLFIEFASLFTWRGRREGVSWVGERISWKFGDFLSCIQYLCVEPLHIGIVTSTVWPLRPNFDNPSYISFHQFDFTKLELKRYFRIVFDTILVILSLKMRVFKKALPKTTFNIRFSIEDHRPSNHIRKTCMKVSK